MHRIFAVLISLTILLNNFQIILASLNNAGELIEHIQYHNEKYGDDMFTFLSKHYGDLKDDHSKNHKEEKQKHQQLPFHQTTSEHLVSAFVIPRSQKNDLTFSHSVYQSYRFFYKESFSFFIPEKLLQPPRKA